MRQRQRQRDRDKETQTDRQKDRGRQTSRQTGRQAGRHTDRQTGRQAGRQTDRQINILNYSRQIGGLALIDCCHGMCWRKDNGYVVTCNIRQRTELCTTNSIRHVHVTARDS